MVSSVFYRQGPKWNKEGSLRIGLYIFRIADDETILVQTVLMGSDGLAVKRDDQMAVLVYAADFIFCEANHGEVVSTSDAGHVVLSGKNVKSCSSTSAHQGRTKRLHTLTGCSTNNNREVHSPHPF